MREELQQVARAAGTEVAHAEEEACGCDSIFVPNHGVPAAHQGSDLGRTAAGPCPCTLYSHRQAVTHAEALARRPELDAARQRAFAALDPAEAEQLALPNLHADAAAVARARALYGAALLQYGRALSACRAARGAGRGGTRELLAAADAAAALGTAALRSLRSEV